MKSKYFKIDFKEGIYFSKFSGDKNKIHLNDLVGHNSIYGEKIVHGIYILLKFLKIKKYNYKKINKLSINYIGHASYNKKIYYIIKKNKTKDIIEIFHNKYRKICEIEINYKKTNPVLKIPSNFRIKKKFITKKKFIKNINQKIVTATSYLTNYVGEIYPGKNSIIRNIEIFILKKDIFKNDIICKSKILRKGYPLILNYLQYKNLFIKFMSIKRPKLNVVLKKPKENILKKINMINKDVLIIGASKGIGYDMLKLLSYNKKINIYATYNQNKIKIKNIKSFQVDLFNNEKYLYDFIKKKNDLNIYYLSSPKIILDDFSKDNFMILNKFFFDIPKKILEITKNKEINFFYPSTEFITSQNKSLYSSTKLKAERMIKKFNINKNKVNFYRLPKINTKQNLSLINEKLINFRELLDKDQELQKVFFFEN